MNFARLFRWVTWLIDFKIVLHRIHFDVTINHAICVYFVYERMTKNSKSWTRIKTYANAKCKLKDFAFSSFCFSLLSYWKNFFAMSLLTQVFYPLFIILYLHWIQLCGHQLKLILWFLSWWKHFLFDLYKELRLNIRSQLGLRLEHDERRLILIQF